MSALRRADARRRCSARPAEGPSPPPPHPATRPDGEHAALGRVPGDAESARRRDRRRGGLDPLVQRARPGPLDLDHLPGVRNRRGTGELDGLVLQGGLRVDRVMPLLVAETIRFAGCACTADPAPPRPTPPLTARRPPAWRRARAGPPPRQVALQRMRDGRDWTSFVCSGLWLCGLRGELTGSRSERYEPDWFDSPLWGRRPPQVVPPSTVRGRTRRSAWKARHYNGVFGRNGRLPDGRRQPRNSRVARPLTAGSARAQPRPAPLAAHASPRRPFAGARRAVREAARGQCRRRRTWERTAYGNSASHPPIAARTPRPSTGWCEPASGAHGPRPERAQKTCNLLGPTALGFRHRDDLTEVTRLLAALASRST